MSQQGEVVVCCINDAPIEEVGLVVISFFRVENAGTMRDERNLGSECSCRPKFG